jgi:hypothetical protein
MRWLTTNRDGKTVRAFRSDDGRLYLACPDVCNQLGWDQSRGIYRHKDIPTDRKFYFKPEVGTRRPTWFLEAAEALKAIRRLAKDTDDYQRVSAIHREIVDAFDKAQFAAHEADHVLPPPPGEPESPPMSPDWDGIRKLLDDGPQIDVTLLPPPGLDGDPIRLVPAPADRAKEAVRAFGDVIAELQRRDEEQRRSLEALADRLATLESKLQTLIDRPTPGGVDPVQQSFLETETDLARRDQPYYTLAAWCRARDLRFGEAALAQHGRNLVHLATLGDYPPLKYVESGSPRFPQVRSYPQSLLQEWERRCITPSGR